MTSTTYSESKLKQGLSVFLWTVKTNLTVIIVYLSIIGFFALTNFALGMAEDTGFRIGLMVFETFLTSMIIGLIVSIRSFSYLHSKRQTDLVGSLPVSRRTMFFSRLISAVVISGIPLLMVSFIINLLFGWNYVNYAGMFLESNNTPLSFLRTFIILVSCIALFGLLSVCCGKTSEKIISFVGINLATPFAVYALMILPAIMLYGYTVDVNIAVVLALSPALAFIYCNSLYWLIFTAVCLILSFFLIKNRKAESAQSHFAYKFPLVAIKVLVSFSAGIVTGFIMVGMSGATHSIGYVMFWIGMIFGSFIAHLIVQLIFNHGAKGFLKGLISYGAMILCFAVFFTALNMGFFGYESYLPNPDQIKSVSFTGNTPCYIDGVNITAHEVTDRKIIKEALSAHKQALNSIDKYKNSPFFSRSRVNRIDADNYDYSYVLGEDDTNYSITYTMNDGSKISREYPNYYYYDDEINEEQSEIKFLRTKEYKENKSPVFVCDEKYLMSVAVDDDEGTMTTYNIAEAGSAEKCRNILKTFKKEYDKYGYSDESSEYTLFFDYGKRNENEKESFDIKTTESVSVPKTFKDTLKIIKSQVNTGKAGNDKENEEYIER